MRSVLPALVLGTAWALVGDAANKPASLVGGTAPDFRSRDAVTHQPIRLSEQQGKVVVLTFWATWCHPCREEVPILDNLQKAVDKEHLLVYAVPFHEPAGTYAAMVKLFRDWHLTLIDDRSEWIASRYHITAIPHLFVIGRDGRVAAEHLGYGGNTLEQLVTEVNAALRPAPSTGTADPPATPAQPSTPDQLSSPAASPQ